MDILRNAKKVRLRSHHKKYLIANEDQETVVQKKNGSTQNARWTVEIVDSGSGMRLKSCYGKYLTASNHPFLLGMTGRKVLQTRPGRLDSSLEWEPIKEGSHFRILTRYGHFLRANGKLPPWRNSVTHDVPHRTRTKDWVLWEVDVVELVRHSDHERITPDSGPDHGHSHSHDHIGHAHERQQVPTTMNARRSASVDMDRIERPESNEFVVHSPPKPDARVIHYRIADENGEVDESVEAKTFLFKGHNVVGLTEKLEEETELEDIFICNRNPLNGKLYPLRLQLPPNNVEMHIVVVPSTSTLGQEFAEAI